MADIFLSYATADRETAQRLATALARHGLSVWWDRTIAAGQRFTDVLDEALRGARCVLVLWSPRSAKSTWVQEEAADGRDRRVLVPVVIERVELPLGFRSFQAIDLSEWDGSDESPDFRRLLADLSRLLGPGGAGAERVHDVEAASHGAQVPAGAPGATAKPVWRTGGVATAGVVAVAVLTIGALAVLPRSAELDLQITATQASFRYVTDNQDSARGERPFLDQVHVERLVVSSFDSIEVSRGSLSVLPGNSITNPLRWREVPAKTPLVIISTTPDAKVTFSDVWIERLAPPKNPGVRLVASEHDIGLGLTALIENGRSVLSIVRPGSDEVFLTCELCRIESAEDDTDRQRRLSQELRITGLAGSPVTVNGRPERLLLGLVPGAGALGNERFRIEALQFCDGDSSGQASSVLGATLSFPEFGRERRIARSGTDTAAVSLAPVSSFVVSKLRLVRIDEPGGSKSEALELGLTGRARHVGVGRDCRVDGQSILPSYLQSLPHRPWTLAIGGAFALLLAGVMTYSRLKTPWSRRHP